MLGSHAAVELPFVTTSGEVSPGEKMALRGTDPESYITEHTLLYEDKAHLIGEKDPLLVQNILKVDHAMNGKPHRTEPRNSP